MQKEQESPSVMTALLFGPSCAIVILIYIDVYNYFTSCLQTVIFHRGGIPMKVILLNGSRREKGCTYTALSVVADTLRENGIDAEIIHAVPDKAVVTAVAEKMQSADGLVIGSPVYWASPTGEIVSFMDQLAGMAGNALVHKVGATVASARRAGTTATLDVLNKYLSYHQMISVASSYWPMVHGNTPDEVRRDEEGLQIMRTLGRNMAWILQCIEAGKKAGIAAPETEAKIMTNFIR